MRTSSRRVVPWLAQALFAVALLAVVEPTLALASPRAEAVLAQLPFSEAERKKILAGELVTTGSREKSSDLELAITMAFLIRKPPTDLVKMFETASGYGTDKSATAFGEISGNGSVAELQGLRLEPGGDAEAKRYADAKPGTDLNLSSAEIAALRALPSKTKPAVEAEIRKLLLARYQAYRARGLAGIAPYDRGGGKTRSAAEELTQGAKASPLLAKEAPEVVKALLSYPSAQPPGAREKFFWVNFAVDGRPTIALTHRLVTPQPDGAYVFVDRHYYVSRSHNAVQIVAGIFPVKEGALVLYANRTFTDQLGGFGAGAKQAIGRRIMGGQIGALYDQIRAQVKK